jgi:hypothetical protein
LPPDAAWLLGGVYNDGLAATILTLHFFLFTRIAAICSGVAPFDFAPMRTNVSIVVNRCLQIVHCHRLVV